MYRSRRNVRVLAFAVILTSTSAPAATKTWNGSQSGSWANGMNWTPAGVPANFDDLVFPVGASNKTNTYDTATPLSVGSITLGDSGYVLGATSSPLFVTSGITASNTSGANTISLNLQTSGSQTWAVTNGAASLTISGNVNLGSAIVTFGGTGPMTVSAAIFGNGGIVVSRGSSGALTLSGPNSYLGPTTISSGNVVLQHPNALGSTAAGTTVNGGVVQVQGGFTFNEDLSIEGLGFLFTGVLVNVSGANVWTGQLLLTGDTNIGVTAGSLDIQGVITGSSGLGAAVAIGGPRLTLSGTNIYAGATTVLQGILRITSSGALGSAAAAGTTVNAGATLEVAGDLSVPEPLTLNGTGSSGQGALVNVSGSATWNGPITLASTSEISVPAGIFGVSGSIGGAGGLTVSTSASGAVNLFGTNTYSGPTSILQGKLNALNPSALGSTASGTVVSAGATLGIGNAITLAAEPLTISGDGVAGVLGALECTTASVNTVTGNVTLAGDALVTTVSMGTLVLSGVVSGASSLTFDGLGTLDLAGNNTYTGTTSVSGGRLLVNGSQPSSAVTVQGGATLGGSGTAGDVTVLANGHLAPGASPGQLAVGNLTLDSGSNFDVELNGLTAGTQFDKLLVNGSTASIGGSNLNLSLGFAPSPGNSFNILAKGPAGGIAGTFAGLPQGGATLLGGFEVQINYTGGPGSNDVFLSFLSPPVASITPLNLNTCPPINTTLTANPTGGTGSYTGYQWFLNGNPIGGATASTHNATQSGFYTVTVTDSASITSLQSSAADIGDLASPTVTTPAGATITQTTCS